MAEAAYLLIKGNPAFRAAPLPDVMDWTYTGNKLHPTQKSIHILKPLIEAFTSPGQFVLDPFAGSGSACVAAQRTGRQSSALSLIPFIIKPQPRASRPPKKNGGQHE